MSEEALVKAAAEMVPRLRERAPQGDVLCRTPDETIAEVEAAGLHMATCPRSRGGAQVSMQTLVDIQTEIGKGDGGTSWTVAVYHASGHWLGGFSDEAQDEFFSSGNPKAAAVFSAGATLRPVSGGYQLTGRWPFPSGQHHSGWIIVPAVVEGSLENGVPDVQALLVPKSDFTVADDWKVTGLVTSGSNTVSVEDVFVPAHRAHSFAEASEGRYDPNRQTGADPYFRTPLVPAICINGVGTVLGLANAAMELFRERIHNRGITYTMYTRQADAPITHIQMAEAQMKLDQAEFHARRLATQIDTMVATAGQWTMLDRVRSRADLSWCVALCREVVEIVQKASGANAIRAVDPLPRIMRDISALSLHAYMLYASNAEIYGRVLCGLDPGVPEV